MKIWLRVILVLGLSINLSSSFAQKDKQIVSHNLEEIAAMERERFANQLNQNLATTSFTNSSTDFDVNYYRCEWEIDPAVRFLSGKVTVYYTITRNTSAISLDLINGLTVEGVTQRSSPLSFQHTNNTIQVNFPASVSSGKRDSISITYSGVPPNTGFGSFVNSSHNGTPIVWTLSAPYGSRDWWPCKNGLDDKADSMDVFITHPAQYKAVANGLRQSEVGLANGKKRTHWKHRYPITTYLVCLAITNYSEFTANVQLGKNLLPIQTFCYPESLTAFQQGTTNTLFAMALFHKHFGDYPFLNEKYGHIQFGWGGGMEHQTGSFMVNLSEGLVAHELAHQWFGDKITCASWEDIWLNEGFATFLASFYMEDKYMPIQRNISLANRQNQVNTITSLPDGSVWVDDTTNVGRIFNSRLTYRKGSHLLYMLRWMLGDDVFFKAIKNYANDPKLHYGFAKTIDLQRHLEEASGRDLTEFFKDWYKGQGYPSYLVQWTPIGDEHVRIKMSQTTSHPSVDFFELPVALKFKNATQETTVVVDNQKNGEIFFRKIGFVPDAVIIDPEYWLISRNNVAQRVNDDASEENMVKVSPNPIQDQFSVYLRNFNQPIASISVYNMQGKKIYNRTVNLIERSNVTEIPSVSWANGLYLIKVESNGSSYVSKVLK
ncbi:MAG: hypothetical protein RI924_78 [Bacteroidota bacterium]|jgi:aminopeptidase N